MAPNVAPDFEELAVAKQFDDVDREIARLALLCRVRVMQPGVIERILHNDATVCETENALAFKKLRELLMMHFVMREHVGESLGAAETQAIIDLVIDRIRKQFAKLGINPPPS